MWSGNRVLCLVCINGLDKFCKDGGMVWFKSKLFEYLGYGGDVCFFGEGMGDEFN